MRFRQALSFIGCLSGLVTGCGAGTELDDYADGALPDIVPSPVSGSAYLDGGVAGKDGGVATGQIGAACTNAQGCKASGGSCGATVNLGILKPAAAGGYCQKAGCTADTDCPTGSGCLKASNTCLQSCTANTGCRESEGYTCQKNTLLTAGKSYCLPPLTGGGGAGGLFGN